MTPTESISCDLTVYAGANPEVYNCVDINLWYSGVYTTLSKATAIDPYTTLDPFNIDRNE